MTFRFLSMCFFTSEFEVLTHFDAVFVIADSVQFIEQRRILLDRCRNACLQIPVRRIHMLPIVDIRIEIQVCVLQFESFAKLEGSRYLVKKHTGEFGTGFWIEFVGTVKNCLLYTSH